MQRLVLLQIYFLMSDDLCGRDTKTVSKQNFPLKPFLLKYGSHITLMW